jgi:hypothetical protein
LPPMLWVSRVGGRQANNGDGGALSKMKPSRWIGSLNLHVTLLALLLGAGAVLASAGPAAAQEQVEPLSAEEVRQLVAPVALYPDELLAVVLPAATNPLQVVQAQRYLEKRQKDQSLQPDPEWDPSILALLNYPDVVAKLNDDLEWTESLGAAVIDQQADVMDAIQQIRAEAHAAGYLQSNEKQKVVEDQGTIVIQSADPEVVYVPTYDPQVVVVQNYAAYPPPVYSNPYPYYYSPAATFFAGAVVGATFAYAFDWHDDHININSGSNCCGNVNINTGDINIGNKVDIDSGRFNADKQRVGTNDQMTWDGQKARQKQGQTKAKSKTKQSVPAASSKATAKQGQAATAKKKQQLSGLGNYETGQKAKKESTRGNTSKTAGGQKKAGQGAAAGGRPSSSTGAFGGYGNGKSVGTQSNRGNKSLKSSGQLPRKRQ